MLSQAKFFISEEVAMNGKFRFEKKYDQSEVYDMNTALLGEHDDDWDEDIERIFEKVPTKKVAEHKGKMIQLLFEGAENWGKEDKQHE